MPLARLIRWQAFIALVGLVLLAAVLAYLSLTLTTRVVPDRGGTYVEGIAGTFRYINPVLCQYNDVDIDLCHLVFSGLARNDASGRVVPDLARSWKISDDGLTYTFYLRRDARWHDGVPVTANDVVFTVQAMQDPDYAGPPRLAELWRSVRVEKVDNYTVNFILEAPYAPFLDGTTVGLLPFHVLATVPAEGLPEHDFNSAPVGTGQFRVEEATSEHVILEANSNFYRGRSNLDRIEFKFYPDYQAVFRAYQRKEVMGISRVLVKDLDLVREDETLDLYSAPLSGYTLVFLNLTNPILEDVLVRQALLLALDRQKMVDDLLGGQGVVADSPIMPFSWAYDPGVRRSTYDPDRSRALLDEAGWRDEDGDGIREKDGEPLRLSLLTNDDEVRVRILEAVVESWEDVGVNVLPQTTNISTLVTDFLKPRRFDAVLFGWSNLPGDPDPFPLWHSSQAGVEGQNYCGYANGEVDRLLEEGRRVHDREEREEMYLQFQQIFTEEVPALLLFYPIYNYAVDSRVQGVQVGPMIDSGGRFYSVSDWYIKTRRMLVTEAEYLGR